MSVRFVISIFCIFFSNSSVFAQKGINKYNEGLAIYKSASLSGKATYGFINHKGKLAIPAIYDTVYKNFQYGLAIVGKNKNAGVIDKKGKTVVPFSFKEIDEIHKHIIAAKDYQGLWGFYNHSGIKITESIYENFRCASKGKIIVQKDGKWGIINDHGEIILKHEYRAIQHVSDKTYNAWKVTTWNVKNTKNETILSCDSDSLRYVGENLYRYSIIGKQGLLDDKGNPVLSKQYEEIYNFNYGLAKVKKDKYGAVDREGKVVVPFIYDDILIDSLYIRVKIQEKFADKFKDYWGLIDSKGNVLIKPKYAMMHKLSEGLIAAMRDDGTWGYITPKGKTEIIFRYIYAEDFKNGRAIVKVPYWTINKELYAVIDNRGEYIISPVDYEFYKLGLIEIERDNTIRYVVPKDKYSAYERINDKYIRVSGKGKFGMLYQGIEIIPCIYERVGDPSDTGLMVVEKEGAYGVVDSKGVFTLKLNKRFEKIFGYNEGYSKMQLKGKYGFIDHHGDIWISAQYPYAGEVCEGMVSVMIRGKLGFMDYRENLKVQPYYEEVSPFVNGVAMVKENGKWNIVNKEGKSLHDNWVDRIVRLNTGRYKLFLGNRVGMADKNGKEILALKYEEIVELSDTMLMVKKNNLWGVLDADENFILPIEHDHIIFEPANKIFITGYTGKQEVLIIK